jgi:hypothetical protein
MKKCFKCNEVKELSEFYPHKKMADGHLNKCKECTKKDSEENLKRKLQDPHWQIKERERQRIKEARRRDLGLTKKYARKQLPALVRKEKYSEYENAIRDGRIKQEPCAVCGKEKTQGHHEDYSKPLDIVWLCTRHHADRHIHLRNAKTLKEEPMPINQFIKTMKLAGNFPL